MTVRWFADLDRDTIALAGGKAANLGELTRAGFPVPPGFCVTTAAYERVAQQAGLESGLDRLLATPAADLKALGEIAAGLRERLLATPVPDDLVTAIEDTYQALGSDVPVAVRSSATAEDLPGASFAGQQDTYLNVVGASAV